MPIEQLPKIAISICAGLAIGAADFAGLVATVKYFTAKNAGKNIFLAITVSEMVRLFFVLGLLLLLMMFSGLSFGWLVAGPLVLSVVKYIYAFRKMKQL